MKKQKPKEEKKDVIFTGKRKRAIARAVLRPGKGVVKINSVPLESLGNEIARMKIQEPLILAGEGWKKYNITVTVRGGGIMGQAEAVRQAISRGIASAIPEAKEKFMKYDRFMLVYDPRRTETHKPPHSSWGARRYKQRSKR